MKNIESLVDEALKEINNVSIDANQVRKILTSLAEKASRNGLQPLPEEMPDEIMVLIGNSFIASDVWKWVKGNFGIKPREWWMGLEKGDKFLDYNGISRLYNGFVFLGTDRSGTHEARLCSPYTEPTTLEQFMQSLTPEQIELAKGLKIEEDEG